MPYFASIQAIAATNQLRYVEVCYENHIDFVFEFNDTLNGYLVPKFILQPIVENAIYHGIDPNSGCGKIGIKSYIREGRLYLEVTDNGVGMSQDTIRQILDCTSLNKAKIGMVNTDRKIKLNYGDKYGIDIKSVEGQGARIIMEMPIIHSKKYKKETRITAGRRQHGAIV